MKLTNLDLVAELKSKLADADAVLQAFEAVPGPTVDCQATAPGNYRRATVDLLPIPKEQAVSAAIRARSKIVAELAQLGVEVDHG